MSHPPIQPAAVLTDKNIDFSNLHKGDLCLSASTAAANATVSYLGFSVRDYEIDFEINLYFLSSALWCDIKFIMFLSTRPTP